MVTEFGMSSKLGAVKYGTGDAEPFMGRDYGHQRDYSEEIAAGIDAEVRDLIEGAHDEAWEILTQYRDVLDAMVLELVEHETLAKPELERILAPVRKRPPHNTFAGFGKRTPSDRPPIEIPEALRKAVTANGASNGTANGQGRALPGLEPDVDAPAPPPSDSGAFGPPQHHGAPYGGYIPPTDSGYEQPGRHGQGGGQGPA
jgi:cell division protease FtsH